MQQFAYLAATEAVFSLTLFSSSEWQHFVIILHASCSIYFCCCVWI